MLNLTRRDGQRIFIGDDIVVTIRREQSYVRVAIEAPGLRVYREEIAPPELQEKHKRTHPAPARRP